MTVWIWAVVGYLYYNTLHHLVSCVGQAHETHCLYLVTLKMLKSIGLKLRKTIGSWLGYYCEVCGEHMEDHGYNFLTRCSNPDCLSHEGAEERFYIPKDVIRKKRGRPSNITEQDSL